MFNMESRHLLNLSVQNALDHIAENFNLKNFLGGACARNSLEKCAVRSPDGNLVPRAFPLNGLREKPWGRGCPDGRYRAHIATLYYISLVYPFLPVRDISISGYRYRALWLVKIKTETKQIWPRATGDESNSYANKEKCKQWRHDELLLVFSVTPFKIDQNKNQNHSIDKVQNLGNERR